MWHEEVNSGGRELMDLVNMNRGKCTVLWKIIPEQYFTQQMDYCAVLILWFVYVSFGSQIFLCCLSHCHYLMMLWLYSDQNQYHSVIKL